MDVILALFIGIGLSAAAGFRIFTPLLITSIASYADWLQLAAGFEWIGTMPALIAFLAATVIEIFAYFIPVIDNAVKLLSAPAAVIAGALLTASFISEMNPFLTWSVAIIAGGGAASVAQAATTALRGASTITTGGAGNFFVSLFEGVSAIFMAILSILLPFLSILFVIGLAVLLIVLLKKLKQSRLAFGRLGGFLKVKRPV